MNNRRDQRGYTLLEVLIAFTLLAIGLGLLLAILSDGMHEVASASESTHAALYAQSMFANLGADQRLQVGHSQGAFENGRYRWTLDVTPFQSPELAPVQPTDPYIAAQQDQGMADNVVLDVVLRMQWGARAGDSLRVETLRAYTPAPLVQP